MTYYDYDEYRQEGWFHAETCEDCGIKYEEFLTYHLCQDCLINERKGQGEFEGSVEHEVRAHRGKQGDIEGMKAVAELVGFTPVWSLYEYISDRMDRPTELVKLEGDELERVECEAFSLFEEWENGEDWRY